MKKVAILGGKRIPFVKSFKEYNHISNQELLAPCLDALIRQFNLEGKRIGEVALGALLNRPTDWNFSRNCRISTFMKSMKHSAARCFVRSKPGKMQTIAGNWVGINPWEVSTGAG
ncbi:hypothetical protein SAMN05660909_00415 [Chitinophaga terrae (ex Kim and Jung 2007)]|uniref:Thiolase N-terminal domain-containing protein n=1 Tax=Chitinophaga terrae (ex Kim and Jung 2007) TaxID=408074 RepID=A0A1H3XEM9_9BACT|nr:hypothetical protein [Chitinophaga terrae (ex Kim and Jung 2007)]SDZ97799.1 hypothetical protein SAMN05660909_00415 [Chitinophaga terrae (ex Kim and Jung 2007)]